jgi:hypothetical protein
VYQGRQTARADPQAVAFVPAGQKDRVIFARSAAEAGLGDVGPAALALQLLGSMLVKGHRLALFDGQRSSWAYAQAEPCPIAQRITHYARLPIDEHNSPFSAGAYTGAAAVAQFFVNLDHLAFCHSHCPPAEQ